MGNFSLESLQEKYNEGDSSVPKDLLDTLSSIESNNNPNAVSSKGARGKYQLMPDTMRNPGYGISPLDPNKPNDDKRLAKDYLGKMYDLFGNWTDAVAAYNAGPKTVQRYREGKQDLPDETKAYLDKFRSKGQLAGQFSLENLGGGKEVNYESPDVSEPLTPGTAKVNDAENAVVATQGIVTDMLHSFLNGWDQTQLSGAKYNLYQNQNILDKYNKAVEENNSADIAKYQPLLENAQQGIKDAQDIMSTNEDEIKHNPVSNAYQFKQQLAQAEGSKASMIDKLAYEDPQGFGSSFPLMIPQYATAYGSKIAANLAAAGLTAMEVPEPLVSKVAGSLALLASIGTSVYSAYSETKSEVSSAVDTALEALTTKWQQDHPNVEFAKLPKDQQEKVLRDLRIQAMEGTDTLFNEDMVGLSVDNIFENAMLVGSKIPGVLGKTFKSAHQLGETIDKVADYNKLTRLGTKLGKLYTGGFLPEKWEEGFEYATQQRQFDKALDQGMYENKSFMSNFLSDSFDTAESLNYAPAGILRNEDGRYSSDPQFQTSEEAGGRMGAVMGGAVTAFGIGSDLLTYRKYANVLKKANPFVDTDEKTQNLTNSLYFNAFNKGKIHHLVEGLKTLKNTKDSEGNPIITPEQFNKEISNVKEAYDKYDSVNNYVDSIFVKRGDKETKKNISDFKKLIFSSAINTTRAADSFDKASLNLSKEEGKTIGNKPELSNLLAKKVLAEALLTSLEKDIKDNPKSDKVYHLTKKRDILDKYVKDLNKEFKDEDVKDFKPSITPELFKAATDFITTKVNKDYHDGIYSDLLKIKDTKQIKSYLKKIGAQTEDTKETINPEEKVTKSTGEVIEKKGTGEKYNLVQEETTPIGERVWTVTDKDGNATQVKESDGYIKKGENSVPFEDKNTKEALHSPDIFSSAFKYRGDQNPEDDAKVNEILNSPNWKDRVGISVSRAYAHSNTGKVFRANPNKEIGVQERTDVDVKLTFDGVPIYDLHNPTKFVDKQGRKIDFSRMTAKDFYSMFYFGEAKSGKEHQNNGTTAAFEQLQREWTALNDFNNAVVTWYQQQKITDPTKWVQLPKEAITTFLKAQLDLVKVEDDRSTLDQIPAFNVNNNFVVWDNRLGKFISGEDTGTEVYNKGYTPDSIFKSQEEKDAFNGKLALATLLNGIQKWIKIVPKTLRNSDTEVLVKDIQDTILELTSFGLDRKENNEYRNISDKLNSKYFIAMKPGWSVYFHIIPALPERNLEARLTATISENGQEHKDDTIFLKDVASFDDLIAQLNSKYNKSGFTFKKTSFKANTEKEEDFNPSKYESTVTPNIVTGTRLAFTYHPEVLIKASGQPTNVLPWEQPGETKDYAGMASDFEEMLDETEGEIDATNLDSILEQVGEKKEEKDDIDKLIDESLQKGVNDEPLFSIGEYVPTVSNKIDYNAALEYLKGILPPFIKVREMEEKVAKMAKYGIAFGALYQSAIYLAKNAPKGTQYHEAFHAVFRYFLNDTQINAALKTEGAIGHIAESDILAQKLNHPSYTRSQLRDLVLEERLADKYKAWKLNKDSQKSSLLKTIFDRIQRFIDWITSAKGDTLEALFQKIDAGKFRNSNVVSNRFTSLGVEPVFALLGPLGARESSLIVATIAGKYIKAYEKNSKITIQNIIAQQAEFNNPTNPINKDIITNPDALRKLKILNKLYQHPEIQRIIMDQVYKKMAYLGYNPVFEQQDDFEDSEQSLRNFDVAEWQYNPYDRVAAETKMFLATTLVKDTDEFGREYERAINDYQVYSSMSVLLTGKEHSEMIPTLLKFSKHKPDTKAVVDRLINETGWSKETPQGNGSLDASQQLTRFYKAFEREKINWTHTEYSAAKGLRSYEAQRNKLEDDVVNDWHRTYQSLSINKKAFVSGIEAFKKKLNNPKLNVEGLDNRMSLQNNLHLLLQSVGITVTPGFISVSLDLDNDSDIEKQDLDHPISIDDLNVLVNKVNKGYNPFIGETEIGDYGMQSILKAWALDDLKFREDFFLKSFQDAENHNRFTYTIPNYAYTRAREIKEEMTNWSQVDYQKMRSEEFALNSLVQGMSKIEIADVFKNAELSILGDYSITKDKNGHTTRDEAVTYKSTTDKPFLTTILSVFANETKETVKDKHGSREIVYTTYPLGINETKQSFFGVKLPVNQTYYSNKEVSDKALERIFNSIFIGEVNLLNSGRRLANRNFTYLLIFSKDFLEDVLKADLTYNKDGSIKGINKIGNTDYNSYKETVKKMIKDYLTEEVSKFKSILDDFKLEGTLSRNLESYGSYDSLIGNFIVNNFISVTGYNQLLRGDAKLYKNFTDWVKRGAGLVATSSSQKGRTIVYAIIKDSKYTMDEKIEKDAPERESDDGQVVGTVDHLIEFLKTQGQLTERKLEILNKIKDPKPGWTPNQDELKEVDLISIKDVTYGKNALGEYVYFKDSTVIYTKLADSFYNFDKKRWEAIPGKEAWRNKRELMEKYGIHQMIPESAVKSLKTAPEDLFDPAMFHQSTEDFDKSIKDKKLEDLGPMVLKIDGKYQGKQVENETKSSDLVILGTQIQNLIDSEVQDSPLRNQYYDNLDKIHQTAFKLALNQLVNEDYTKKDDITKFLDKVRDSIEETTPDLHLLHFLKAVNGDMLGDSNLPHIATKFQQYFFAHFSKILKTKFKGDKKTIVASNGYNVIYDTVEQRVVPNDEVIKRASNGENFNTERYTKRRLSVIFKDNGDIDYIEIVATRRNPMLLGASIGEIIELNPKIIEGIGTRIPTDSHHSMMRYKIVEFIPEYYGSTIMTAPERLRLAGEDMDIDSIFTYTYDFYNKNGRPVLFGTATTDEEKWEEFKEYQLLRNKDLRKVYKDNKEVMSEVLGGLPALKEIGLPSTFKEYKEAGSPDNIGTIQNRVLDIYQQMLQKPELQESLKTATDTSEMGKIADRIYTSLRGKSKSADSFSTLSGLYNSWKNVTTGSANIGIAALSNTTSAVLTKYKVNLKPDFELTFNDQKYDTFDSTPEANREKAKNIGMVLNVMADNAKDPIAAYANLPYETFGYFTPMLSLGVPLETATLFMNQPIMDEYIHRLRTGEKKFRIINEFKSRYLLADDQIPLNLSNAELESSIINNRIKEGLSKEQKIDLDLIQARVFQQLLRLDAISQNFQQVSSILSINRGLGASFEDMDNIEDALKKLDITGELSNFKKTTTVSFDFNKVIENNKLIQGNIAIYKNVLKAFENYSIRATTPYKEIYKELSKSLKSSLKKTQKEQIKNDLQTYITMKTFIKQFKIDTDKYNKLLKPGEDSIVKQYKDLTKMEDFKRNRFVQWLKAVPVNIEQAGQMVSNPNNTSNLELLISDSRLKINVDIQENIVNAFEHLQKDKDPEIKAFVKNLIPYLLVKDNLTFRNRSFIKFISPSMFAQEGRADSLANILKKLNIAFKNNDNEAIKELTGFYKEDLTKDFIELFSRHIRNGNNVKTIDDATNPRSAVYKVGNNIGYSVSYSKQILSISLAPNMIRTGQLGGNTTFDIEESKNGHILKVLYPDFFMGTYFDNIENTQYKTLYKKIKGNDKSAVYQQIGQFGNFAQMPYHMTIQQLEAEKVEAQEPDFMDNFDEFNEASIDDIMDSIDSAEDIDTQYGEVQDLDDIISKVQGKAETKESFPFKPMTDDDINNLPDNIKPCD